MKSLRWTWTVPLLSVVALVAAGTMGAAQQAAAQLPGKFYIVGMGTCPDLMTLRAAKVCEKTDVFLLEEQGDAVAWKEIIGSRPVIYCPHGTRVGYGADISKVKDPAARAVLDPPAIAQPAGR